MSTPDITPASQAAVAAAASAPGVPPYGLENVNNEGNDRPNAAENASNSANDALLEYHEKIMANAKRDFETILDAPDLDVFIQRANQFANITLKHIWVKHRLTEAQEYLSEWKKASRTYLDLTAPHQLEERAKSVDLNYQNLLTLLTKAEYVLFQLNETVDAKKEKDSPTATASLPKLTIKPFSGESLVEYPAFMDAVRACILNNPKLNDCIKLVYLYNLLKGKALAAVSHHPLNKDSLPLVLSDLESRYNQPKLILSSVVNKLVMSPRINENDVAALRNFLDRVQQAVAIIKKHDKHLDQSPSVLLTVFKNQLPSSTLEKFEEKLFDRLNTPALPPLEKTMQLQFFLEWLSSHINRQELVANRDVTKIKNSWEIVSTEKEQPLFQQSSQVELSPKNTEEGLVPTKSFETSSKYPNNGSQYSTDIEQSFNSNMKPKIQPGASSFDAHNSCIFCPEPHFSGNCQKALDNPYWAHHITIKKGRCKSCFEYGHLAFSCPWTSKCGICQDPNHHTVLHIPDPQTDDTYHSDDAESVHTENSQSYDNEDDNEN